MSRASDIIYYYYRSTALSLFSTTLSYYIFFASSHCIVYTILQYIIILAQRYSIDVGRWIQFSAVGTSYICIIVIIRIYFDGNVLQKNWVLKKLQSNVSEIVLWLQCGEYKEITLVILLPKQILHQTNSCIFNMVQYFIKLAYTIIPWFGRMIIPNDYNKNKTITHAFIVM